MTDEGLEELQATIERHKAARREEAGATEDAVGAVGSGRDEAGGRGTYTQYMTVARPSTTLRQVMHAYSRAFDQDMELKERGEE